MFLFDLQLFGGGPNQQQQSSDQYYQQEANQSNQLFNQYEQNFLPIAMQLIPQLQQAAQGSGPLAQAAMAPVNAQTARSLNTIQNNAGGYTNTDALASDISLNGQQTAGLAADNLVSGSVNALMSLFGMGQSGAGMGLQGLNGAAGGEGNLGNSLWGQQNAWWQSLISGAGNAAGMAGKGGAGGGGASSASSGGYGQFISPQSTQQPFIPMESGNVFSIMAGNNAQPGQSVTQSGMSLPASSNALINGVAGLGANGGPGSYVPPKNPGY